MELYGKWRQRAEWMMIFHCSRLWGGSHSVWIPLYFVFVLLCSTSYLSSWHKFSCFFFSPRNLFTWNKLDSLSAYQLPPSWSSESNSTAPATSVSWCAHTHTHKYTCWQKHTLIQKNHKRAHIRTHAHKCMETHTRTHRHTHTHTHGPSVFVSLPLPSPWVCLQKKCEMLRTTRMLNAPRMVHFQLDMTYMAGLNVRNTKRVERCSGWGGGLRIQWTNRDALV